VSNSDENVGSELLARLLADHEDVEQKVEHFHMVGRVIGAVYNGMVREGASEDVATHVTIEWMECHLFDRIEKLGGYTPVETSTDDEDEDSTT
jgi:hypothetical protein